MIEVSVIIGTTCFWVVTITCLGSFAIVKSYCLLSAKCDGSEHQICLGVGPCCQEVFV